MLARRLAALLFVLFVSAAAHAQIAWSTTDHDFGSINEGDRATYVFTFTNEGDEPLTLTEVRASCGCTTPSYTTEPVAPGAEGSITVMYNSEGRPGDFEKYVYVRATAGDENGYELHIRGTVVPVAVEHFVTQGNVRFNDDDVELTAVDAAEPLTHTFQMANAGERPIRIRAARAYGTGAEVQFPDRPVFPGDVVQITLTAPAPTGSTFDYAIVLDTDDAVQPSKSLRVRGTAVGS